MLTFFILFVYLCCEKIESFISPTKFLWHFYHFGGSQAFFYGRLKLLGNVNVLHMGPMVTVTSCLLKNMFYTNSISIGIKFLWFFGFPRPRSNSLIFFHSHIILSLPHYKIQYFIYPLLHSQCTIIFKNKCYKQGQIKETCMSVSD